MKRVLPWWILLAVLISAAASRAQDTSCLNELVPCLEYTNSNKTPSSSCCNPLKSLIKSNPQCLCSMLRSNSSTQEAGVNMTQAQLLPQRWGEKVNASLCKSKHPMSSEMPLNHAITEKTNTFSTNLAELLIVVNAVVVALLSLVVQTIWVTI